MKESAESSDKVTTKNAAAEQGLPVPSAAGIQEGAVASTPAKEWAEQNTGDHIALGKATTAPSGNGGKRNIVRGLITGMAVAALAVAASALAFLPPADTNSGGQALPLQITRPPAVLICPPPVQLLVPGTEGDPEFAPAPVASQIAARILGPGSMSPALAQLGRDTTVTPTSTVTLTGAAAGAIGIETTQGDLRGLAAASCRPAQTDAWLAGGTTTKGSSVRLAITNPATIAAAVTVQLYTGAGPVLATARSVAIAPGETRTLMLEAIAPEAAALVVHVTSSNVPVVPIVTSTRLQGLTPAGVDYVVPSASPAATTIVGPVLAAQTSVDGANPSVLRLLSPQKATTARITFLSAGGPTQLPGLAAVELAAGQVFDLNLGGLGAGAWFIQIEADSEIVAGAMSVLPGDQNSVDIGWSGAAKLPTGTSIATLPPNTSGELGLIAASDTKVTVTPIAAGGRDEPARVIELKAQRAFGLKLGEAVGVRIDTQTPLAAGIIVSAKTNPTFVSMLDLVPIPPAVVDVDVTVR